MAWYLVKVTICSGILYTYYIVALKNKSFHRWNRFFLLTAVILSLMAPLIRINITQKVNEPKAPTARLVQVVTGGDDFFAAYVPTGQAPGIDVLTLLTGLYCCVSLLVFALLINALLKIYRLKKCAEVSVVEGVNVISTDARGTPFSFLNNIFWNPAIDVSIPAGKQIFKHELVHVREKHSYDKVFINALLIIFWCNPFIWLIRREISMVHEFIADKNAVEDNDTAAFAGMILLASYPQHYFNIVNSFAHSPLKRRLIMLTKNKNSGTYLSRLLVLPLAALLFVAFTLKLKTTGPAYLYKGKKMTVVIDAGHGGEDWGGTSKTGIYEKDLTLGLAKKVQELNKNENLNVILTRDKDETISVKERTEKTKMVKADLFVSIHIDVNKSPENNNGLQVLVPGNGNAYLQKSRILGSAVNESFTTNGQFAVTGELQQSRKGIWVLKENSCPAVLLQVGFINNQEDLDYLTNADNQQTIANNILNGIEKYAEGK